jgi:short-subunit dehydrogenase
MNKAALITGSTSGIGKAFAEKLAQEKHDLFLVSRNAEKLAAQADTLSSLYGIEAVFFPVDLAEPGAAKLVFERAGKLGLSVDILVNNAGFNEAGSFLNTSLEKEIQLIQIHTVLPTELMKYFIPQMVKAGFGRILNLGSTGSHIACPYDAVYAAAKAYILFVSKAINDELKGTGVNITTLCPGATETEFAAKAGLEKTPLFKRNVMKPETVAEIGYKALMKEKASVIAGFNNKCLVLISKCLSSSITAPMTKKMLTNI